MIKLNVGATTQLTHMLLPQMLARKHKCLIINMSSFTSLIPSPMLAVYGATKAYVKHLSLSLADEFRGKVDVMSVAPWWVVTSMTKIRRASLTAVSPDHFVREVMKSVGTADHCDPYWFHALIESLPPPSHTRNPTSSNLLFPLLLPPLVYTANCRQQCTCGVGATFYHSIEIHSAAIVCTQEVDASLCPDDAKLSSQNFKFLKFI
eukprot:TRINITY_DN217_c0_g1_i2.p1 TRINITY_DN217_c0_g1~~TRINITY_DN217_c0_g1_i2.p1  ORF type:complete len:206 (-),score=32.93 TRINITY_DN217_c0_g1_i2:36-653(-)